MEDIVNNLYKSGDNFETEECSIWNSLEICDNLIKINNKYDKYFYNICNNTEIVFIHNSLGSRDPSSNHLVNNLENSMNENSLFYNKTIHIIEIVNKS